MQSATNTDGRPDADAVFSAAVREEFRSTLDAPAIPSVVSTGRVGLGAQP